MAGAAEVNERFNAIVERLHVQERYETLLDYARQNPLKTIFVGVVLATCLFPVILFMGFVLSSIVFGLISLLIIEGTALSFGIVTLFFVLAGCLAVSLTLTGVLVGSFFTVRYGKSALTVACQRLDECASKWENQEGRVGQMIKCCRGYTERLCAACCSFDKKDKNSSSSSEDVFDVPEKQE